MQDSLEAGDALPQDFFPMCDEEQAVGFSWVHFAEALVIKGRNDSFSRSRGGDDQIAAISANRTFCGQCLKDFLLIRVGAYCKIIACTGFIELGVVPFIVNGILQAAMVSWRIEFKFRRMPIRVEGGTDFVHSCGEIGSGDFYIPFKTTGNGGVRKIRGADVRSRKAGIAIKNIGLCVQPGALGIIGNPDFCIGQGIDIIDCLDVGSAHVGGGNETKPAAILREGPQFFGNEPEAAPFDEGDKHIDTVTAENFLFKLTEHAGLIFGTGEKRGLCQ